MLLALDWSGGQPELLVRRSRHCDVVLASGAVSRRHARDFCFATVTGWCATLGQRTGPRSMVSG